MLAILSDLPDLIGVIAFAFSGLLATREKPELDPVGVFVLAFATAFGGGIIRDTIIHANTFWFVANEGYVWLTIVMAVFSPVLVDIFGKDIPYSAFIWADAIGLGAFAAGGTAVAYAHGLPMLSSVLMGVATGAAGGMIRDVLMDKLPLVLSDRKPYALVAFIGSWLCVLMIYFGVNSVLSVWVSSFFICGFRMLCWYADWEIRYRRGAAVLSDSLEHEQEDQRKIEEIRRAAEQKGSPDSPSRD